MHNLVSLELILTEKMWGFNGRVYGRGAGYRDNDRESKPGNGVREGRDEADYFTVCFPAGASLEAGNRAVHLPDGRSVQAGQFVQVTGWLSSREYKETGREFVEKARIPVDGLPDSVLDAVVERSTTWINVDRIVVISEEARGKKHRKAVTA